MHHPIKSWLDETNFPVRQLDEKTFVLRMEHRYAEYYVTISTSPGWVHYGADLFSAVEGEDTARFYEEVLKLNGRLNGPHIAIEEGRIVLIRDGYAEYAGDLNRDNLYRDLYQFLQVHERVYDLILSLAETYKVTWISAD